METFLIPIFAKLSFLYSFKRSFTCIYLYALNLFPFFYIYFFILRGMFVHSTNYAHNPRPDMTVSKNLLIFSVLKTLPDYEV